MKNMMKKTICAMTLAAVCVTSSLAIASTASASGHDVQDEYISDSDSQILSNQASCDSPAVLYADDSGYCQGNRY